MTGCCTQCLRNRRRSFFSPTGVCEACDPSVQAPPPAPGEAVMPLNKVVAIAAAQWAREPWVTVNEGRDRGIPSSADKLFLIHWGNNWDVDHSPALPALQWLKELSEQPEAEQTDYLCWLVLLWRRGYVTADTFALGCSIPNAFEKTKTGASAPAPAPKKEGPVEGAFFGEVGKRMDIPLVQCTQHKSLGTNTEHPEWGERFLIRFIAATGENLVWFASSGGAFDPQEGGTYNIRATIFKHEPYNGKASTIIQRPAEYDPTTGKLLNPPKRRKKEESE